MKVANGTDEGEVEVLTPPETTEEIYPVLNGPTVDDGWYERDPVPVGPTADDELKAGYGAEELNIKPLLEAPELRGPCVELRLEIGTPPVPVGPTIMVELAIGYGADEDSADELALSDGARLLLTSTPETLELAQTLPVPVGVADELDTVNGGLGTGDEDEISVEAPEFKWTLPLPVAEEMVEFVV